MTLALDGLAIPTAWRPFELRRAVSSYAKHFVAAAQDVPITVFHSPRSRAEQDEVRASIRDALPHGPQAVYVGLAEKVAMAKRLRRATHVEPRLLDFALFDPLGMRTTTGANRNAALLWLAGGRFLSCDDDTVAELYVHPQMRAGAALLPGVAVAGPEVCFVPPDGDLDPFRLAAGDARFPDGGLVDALDGLWCDAAAAETPAPLVFLGLAGDCGWSAPFGFFGMPLGYLQLPPQAIAHLAATPEMWQAVLTSRTVLRIVESPVLSRGTPGMTTAVGIDATDELPPFLPVGRGQDLIFTAMTETLRNSPSAHLPVAVAHRPAGQRRFRSGELWRAAESLDLCRTLFALLEAPPSGADLAGLGRRLRAVAQDPATFEEALRSGRRAQLDRLCAAAREFADGQVTLPSWWRDDLLEYCDRAERAAYRVEPLWVLDAGADPSESMQAARTVVGTYGQLCEAWPALFAAARDHDAAGSVAGGRAPPAPAPRVPARCSPYQTWLWRLHVLDPADGSYVVFLAARVTPAIDADVLERSLRALARRHHALRSRLPPGPDDEPLLDLRDPDEVVVDRVGPFDLDELARARHATRLRPFDLVAAVPIRTTLAAVAGGGWELWVAVHHVAFDGVSEGLFWRELEAIYQNLAHGRDEADGLAPLRADYATVAQRQRDALLPEVLDALTSDWRERLRGVPGELPVSFRQRGPSDGAASVHRRVAMPSGAAAQLRQVAARLQVTGAAVSLAVWQAVLARWSGETDLLIAVNVANRLDAIDDEQIGLFMSVLLVRGDLSGDPPLAELARRARGDLAGAWERARLPFDRMIRTLGDGRRRFGMVHAVFTYEQVGGAPTLAGDVVQQVDLDDKQTGFDIGLTVEESGDALHAVLSGNAGLFDGADLQRLGEAFGSCLAQLSAAPGLRPSDVDWLSPGDEQLLTAWSSTDTDAPVDRPLTELLRERADATPETVALIAGGVRLTYAELHRRADVLAARLRARGIDRDAIVGVYLDRDPLLLESILGVLRAGGAYLPLDPAFPRERLTFMLEDADVRVLVTRRGLVDDLPPHGATVVCVDDDAPPSPEPPGWQGPAAESLAYVLYTSGSTGTPKGVEVPHSALVNFLCSMAREPGLGAGDALLALTTLSFDIAGLELWLPLLVGATVVLAGRDEAADGALLATALARSRATMLQATPSTWRILFASGWQGDPGLTAIVGGEALPVDLAARLAASCGPAWNMYGPTETTIWSAAWRIPSGAAHVRIGRPIANTQLHVLDPQLRRLPIGVTGELWIGGAGLARGYRHRPELTAERFVPDPFRPGGRMYRTGDLARWLPDGQLEFLGRNDNQLKLRGYRIEPGEIEAALHLFDGVAHAAVDLHRQGVDDDRLVAYLVRAPGAMLPTSADLRARLRERLADYLVPHHFVEVPALPYTPNGKVDRKRLDALFRVADEPVAAAADLDPLAQELIAEFAALLPVPIGPDTDFFEAGGDSLTALRLVDRVSRRHGTTITGGDLFVDATPRRLATRLRPPVTDDEHPPRPTHLRELRAGSSAPIVFVHPIGGELLPYLQLAATFNDGDTVLGLQSVDGEHPFASINERCTAYLHELQRLPPGPLLLGGYSLGGVLALELAGQLQRAGHPVDCVFLLDSWVPRPDPTGLARIVRRLSELQVASWTQRRAWFRSKFGRRAGADRRQNLILTLNEQAVRWRPTRYDGQVVLFRSVHNRRGHRKPVTTLGWEAHCPNLTVIDVEGHHEQIVSGPPAASIVDEIRRRMPPATTRGKPHLSLDVASTETPTS